MTNSAYVAVHIWMKYHFGKATKCGQCAIPAKRYEWANISGKYKRIRSDWNQLCPSCHRLRDKGQKCIRGHRFTETNTTTRKDKPRTRICKECHKIRYTKYITNKLQKIS